MSDKRAERESLREQLLAICEVDLTWVDPDAATFHLGKLEEFVNRKVLEAERKGYDNALDQLAQWSRDWCGTHGDHFNYYGAIMALRVSKDMQLPFVALTQKEETDA